MPGMRRSPAEKVEKGTFKKSIKKLLLYCKKYWGWIILSLVIGALAVIPSIYGPNKIKEIMQLITGAVYTNQSTDIQAVEKIAFLLLSLYISGALLNYLQNYLIVSITQRITRKLRKDISNKINRLPLKYFDTHLHGDTLSRVTNDVETVGQSMSDSIGTLFSSLLLFIGVLIMMFITDWIMALTVIGATMIGFAFSLIFLVKSQKYFIENQKNFGEMSAHVEEVYSGHNVIQLFNAKEEKGEEFKKINKKLYNSAWKSQFISGTMGPLMGFVSNLGYVAVCVVGAILASQRGVAFIGVISAFMIYVSLFSRPLSEIAQTMTSLQSAAAASSRVFEFLENEEVENEDAKNTVLDKIEGNIEFKDVKFGYTKEKIILNDFSAFIHKGEKVAIVGPTGAGKTTLVNLLMRFYEINSGDIVIDGKSIKELTREQIHSLFGMVLQDTWLFEGTIIENLRYNTEGVSEEKIIEICKKVGIDHFIQTLPHGYNTKIDDTINISAGQKQLLTIARTMIADKPMIILDEATSSVDTRTELLLQQAMDKAMEGRTSFVIAHRLSTIKNADLILVLKDGDIIEKGKHEELLKNNGFYAQLYNSQFENV